MNVFVLPSWYPSRTQPMAGLFVREQVAALAACRPAWNIVVGGWGFHDGALSLRSFGASARALAWRLRAPTGWAEPGGRHEVTTPRLSWTLALAGGGAAGLLSASRRNLALARARFGAPDVIHAHVGFPAGWMAARLSAEQRIPFVLTEHMGPFPPPPLADARGRPVAALREAYGAAAAVVAVSPALAERIRSFGLRCDAVVPNAVDATRFAYRPRLAPPTAPRVLLSLGALTPGKGFDVLLQAFARWNPPAGRVRLRIGGAGPEAGRLRALAAALGLEDRVQWLGAVPPSDVPSLMTDCDAFVLASHHETFGVVLAEAALCGRPLLATRCGGPDSIVNAVNGLLVAPGDVEALARGLADLNERLDRPDGFDAAAIRSDAERRFGRAAVGEAVARLLAHVAAGHRGVPAELR